MSGVLDGLKVLDVGSWVAGPAAATVLADFGAEVVKVEPPMGDPYRHLLAALGEPNPCYEVDGRNKRSLAVDLGHLDGQTLVQDLAAQADVLVTNFRPRLLERLGLAWEGLAARNPRLVFAQVTAYGSAGPDADRAGFDTTAWWGRSGLQDFIRAPGQPPQVSAPGMGDHATAMSLFGGILLALYARERSGRGQRVDTSLLANGVWSNAMVLAAHAAGFDWTAARQDGGPGNPLATLYPTADGRAVMFSVLNPAKELPALLAAMDRLDLAEDPRVATPEGRRDHPAVLHTAIAEWLLRTPLAVARAALETHAVTHGVASSAGEVLDDPQVRAAGMLAPFAEPPAAPTQTITSPVHLSAATKVAPRRAPRIGEHSAAVLGDWGVDEARAQALLAAGVVVQEQDVDGAA